jgi:anti-anti-sigma regulatory factor
VVGPQGPQGAAMRAFRAADDPGTIEIEIRGRIDRADAARFGREVRTLLDEHETQRIVCDVGAVTRSDVAVVDAVCRMRLVARRRGCELMLRGASTDLLDLLSLVGLTNVIPNDAGSGLEVEGQFEQREHPRGVEEERDPADPPV